MIVKNQLYKKNRTRSYGKIILKRCIGMGIFFTCCTTYHCPVKYFFHVTCPGCGTTRALISALRLNFRAAVEYNACFPIPVIWCIYILFREKICIGKRKEEILIYLSLLLYLFRWIFTIM